MADKGYAPQKKVQKSDPDNRVRRARLAFCHEHVHRTSAQWQHFLQGVADFKDYTYYPKDMKARFERYRASWTYMKKSEKYKRAFVRPKTMFKRTEYKRAKKGKVFGITLSNGKQMLCHCSTPFSAKKFATLVRTRLGPFVRASFPARRRCLLLLDGEKFMHAPEANRAMKAWRLAALPRWPARSPDLNPQENVWPWIEKRLRKRENRADTFPRFKHKLTCVGRMYPNGSGLVRSLERRVAMCIEQGGAMIKK